MLRRPAANRDPVLVASEYCLFRHSRFLAFRSNTEANLIAERTALAQQRLPSA
jgi:hypothetical protein